MTKEELKQEAEKSLDKRLGTYAYIRKQDCYTNYVDGYMDSAEPREKRIAELEEEVTRLRNESLDIINKYTRFAETDRRTIVELEAEIENDRDLPAIAYMQGAEKQKKKDEGQLTKAKEIIKYLCGMVRELNKPNVQLTNVDYSLSEAEQFLSEVKK